MGGAALAGGSHAGGGAVRAQAGRAPADAEPAERRDALPDAAAGRSIVLVGLMGCGKSTVGRRLATRLGLPFVDADDEIEKAAGRSISEIFATLGESAFRDGERRVIARLLGEGPLVLATGGGAFMDPATRCRVRRSATSVWLRAELDVLVRRCQRRTHRPLLAQGNPREILRDLMERRHPVYAEADIAIDSGEEDHDAVVERIVAALAAAGALPDGVPPALEGGHGR